MNRRFAVLALLPLAGCAGAGSLLPAGAGSLLQNPSSISGTAAGLFGLPAATVASQVTAEITEIQAVATSLQMLRAQLNGAPIMVPALPVPPVVVGTTVTPPAPVPVPTPTPGPGGPIVTPNMYRWSG
jgi:hypothetical protein